MQRAAQHLAYAINSLIAKSLITTPREMLRCAARCMTGLYFIVVPEQVCSINRVSHHYLSFSNNLDYTLVSLFKKNVGLI